MRFCVLLCFCQAGKMFIEIEVIICLHVLTGPMLLFDKYVDGRKVETFYACSAQREGKNCSSKTQVLALFLDQIFIPFSSDEIFYLCFIQMPWNHEMMSYDDVIAIHPTKRKFCCQCQKVCANYSMYFSPPLTHCRQQFIREDDSATHIKHEKKTGITNADLITPSLLFLTPKENTKTNAVHLLLCHQFSHCGCSLIFLDLISAIFLESQYNFIPAFNAEEITNKPRC